MRRRAMARVGEVGEVVVVVGERQRKKEPEIHQNGVMPQCPLQRPKPLLVEFRSLANDILKVYPHKSFDLLVFFFGFLLVHIQRTKN
jgi:hypothetical protein